jgi:hypothetical protein
MADWNHRNPEDNSRSKDTIEYYIWLAKLAEKGKITSIFFADTYAVHDTYQGKADASFRGGHAAGQLDPTIMAATMCSVTKSVSVGITGSTTYIPVSFLHTRGICKAYKVQKTGKKVVSSWLHHHLLCSYSCVKHQPNKVSKV